MTPINFKSSYFSRAYGDRLTIASDLRTLVTEPFDTLVGTGLSGSLVIPDLARTLNVHWLIVRKPDDRSHALRLLEGMLGERWLFVDDFIESGATLKRVRAAVDEETCREAISSPVSYVGAYLYQRREFHPSSPEPSQQNPLPTIAFTSPIQMATGWDWSPRPLLDWS